MFRHGLLPSTMALIGTTALWRIVDGACDSTDARMAEGEQVFRAHIACSAIVPQNLVDLIIFGKQHTSGMHRFLQCFFGGLLLTRSPLIRA